MKKYLKNFDHALTNNYWCPNEKDTKGTAEPWSPNDSDSGSGMISYPDCFWNLPLVEFKNGQMVGKGPGNGLWCQ